MQTILNLQLDGEHPEKVYPCLPASKDCWIIREQSFLQRIESIANSSTIEQAVVEKVEDEVDGSTRFLLTAYLFIDSLIDYAETEDGRLVLLMDVTPPDPCGADSPKDVLPVYNLNVDDPEAPGNAALFTEVQEPD